jgi:Putative zinc-finger
MFRVRGVSPCRKVRGLLSEYIDNSLSSEDKSFIELHLQTCDDCSKELESLRVTVQLLHRVPEVPVPRSFTVTVPERKRERALAPAGLRWLRPATAIIAVALVVLLAGDFSHAFVNNAGVKSGSNGTYVQLAPAYTASEQQVMVTVPGVIGQMSLATAKAVGYTNYNILPPPPPSEVITQPVPSVRSDVVLSGSGITAQGEAGVGWPLRQTEIGLGAVGVVLLALMIFARRQLRGRVTVR